MEQTDLEKSIRTKRLRLKQEFGTGIGPWATRAFIGLTGAIILCFSIKDMWDGFTADNLPISRVIIGLLLISFSVWVIHGVVYLDKLTLIRGTEKSINRKLMNDLLAEMFDDMEFLFINDHLVGLRPWKTRKPGKEINVIFNDSDLFINITHKVRFGDMPSPFHVLKNQMDIKEIETTFLLRIKTTANKMHMQ